MCVDHGTSRRSLRRTQLIAWAGYAACAWMLLITAVHVYWATGGTVGLPPDVTVSMNRMLFVIDIVAIPLSVGGALLALALVRPLGQRERVPRRLLLAAGWSVCALMVLHAAPTLIEGGLMTVGILTTNLTPHDRFSLFVYEPWWLLGGLLFSIAAWHYTQQSRE
jgi:uncharacterized ion transporter superfamily protein YfcC